MTERRYIKNDEEAILKFKNLYKKVWIQTI